MKAAAHFALLLCFSLACSAEAQVAPAANSPPSTPQDAMVLIHGATFQMGIEAADIPRFQEIFAIDNPKLFLDELPRHTVTVKDFYLDKYLVTNLDFHQFVAANPQWEPGGPTSTREDHYLIHWSSPGTAGAQMDHPVVNVTWYAAQAFCHWRGKRLPSETEWEFAALGGQTALFPWGNAPAEPMRANFNRNIGTTTPVDSYPPNPYGLFDMAGNVWQFLADPWEPYSRTITSTKRSGLSEAQEADAIGSLPESRRVIRGGSFAGHPVNLWVEYRDSHAPNNPREYVGFRCAKSPPR